MRRRIVRQKLELKRQQNVQRAWEELYNISSSLTPEKIRDNESLLEQHQRGLQKRLTKMRIPNHKTIHIYKQYSNYIKNHKKHTEHALMHLVCISETHLKR